MIEINELFWVMFLVFFGACFGWSLRDWYWTRLSEREHQEHMGLYGDPNLAYWFRLRASETDPYWQRMPLREYASKKQLIKGQGK